MTTPPRTAGGRPARRPAGSPAAARRLGRLVTLAALLVPAAALAAVAAPGGESRSTAWLVTELIGSMVVILAGCELFANAVEHVGDKAGLSHAAAGSLLAAVGTALPETLIPILAILFGAGGHGAEIGIGAILGAPFMLSTLAFFWLGLTVTLLYASGRRKRWQMEMDVESLTFELRWFLLTLTFVFLVSIAGNRTFNLVGGAVVLVIYALYFRHQLGHEGDEHEEYTDTFYLQKLFRLPLDWRTVIGQLLVGLTGIVVGANLFVNTIAALSVLMGISALVLSLIVAPIATELPEKYNSITWTIRRQDTLAMGNISGALVFQSTIPVSIGLWFTDWALGGTEIMNLVLTALSTLLVLLVVRSKGRLPAWPLLVGGLFYAIYLVRIFAFHVGGA